MREESSELHRQSWRCGLWLRRASEGGEGKGLNPKEIARGKATAVPDARGRHQRLDGAGGRRGRDAEEECHTYDVV